MAPVTPETTRLEVRRTADKKLRLFFDGEPIQGVTEVTLSQVIGERPVLTVSFFNSAFRLVDEAAKATEK